MVLRIVADREKCEGHGMCEATSHEYFELDDTATVVVLNDTPDDSEKSFVQAAVDSCPVAALSLVEE
jgi:ferredoxin